MHKTLIIARREYLQTVKSPGFIVAVGFLVVMLVVGHVAIGFLASEQEEAEPIRETVRIEHNGTVHEFKVDRPPARSTDDEQEMNPYRATLAIGCLLLMSMGIMFSTPWLLSNLIEEKSSRVVEVMLSAVSPLQLMAGKVVGLAGVGLTGVAILVFVGVIPAAARGLVPPIPVSLLFYFAFYYVMGYLMYAALFAAVGSVCSTIRDSQALVTPVMLFLIGGMYASQMSLMAPGGRVAIVLSALPPLTPFMMITRIAAVPDLPFYQVLVSVVILGASVPVIVWAGARIFRTGILMYGKRPSLREMFRWLRES